MNLRNSDYNYGVITKLFHWIMAIIIIGMIVLGQYMPDLEVGPQKQSLYRLHKSFGTLILILVAFRILWRARNITPALPANTSRFERLGANASHYALYFLMVYMPIVGWLMSSAAGSPVSFFGIFTLPNLVSANKELMGLFKDMHAIGGNLFIAVIGLHFAAGLFHHFYKKDDVLKKMLPF